MNCKTVLTLCLALFPITISKGAQSVATPTQSSPAAAYLDSLIETVDRTVKNLPEIVSAAEAAADKALAGGKLWLAGDKGFILEGLNRAGGTVAAKWLHSADEVSGGDVVLFGALGGDSPEEVALLAGVSERAALVVLFGPENMPGDHLFIDVFAPPANDAARLPSISPALACSLWTFTCEWVAALTRQGKMPTMLQSVLTPGARERNEERNKMTWEPMEVRRVDPIVLGRTYLARLANIMRKLRATQMDEFAEAGRMAAEAIAAGHAAWSEPVGHMPPEMPGQVGDPGLLKMFPGGSDPDKMRDLVKPGDVILYVGYYEPFGPWVETARECGVKIATVLAGTPETPAEAMGADININGCWPYGDALVEIEGYDVTIIPPSGVIQCAAYWMLVAETVAASGE